MYSDAPATAAAAANDGGGAQSRRNSEVTIRKYYPHTRWDKTERERKTKKSKKSKRTNNPSSKAIKPHDDHDDDNRDAMKLGKPTAINSKIQNDGFPSSLNLDPPFSSRRSSFVEF